MENTKTVQAPTGAGVAGAHPATEEAPVSGKILRISKYAYNTIRSLVESSPKSQYWFNQPRFYLNAVRYVKEGRWVVEVKRPNDVETVVSVYDRSKILTMEVRFSGSEPTLVYIDGREIQKPYSLVVVLPREEVAFARPINLMDIVERLLEFKNKGELLLKNRPEEVP